MAQYRDLRELQSLTPEQKILINWFWDYFNSRIAANRRIIAVEPLFYAGIIVGSEFVTYAATKLYLCFSLKIPQGGAPSLASGSVIIYNELNITISNFGNQNITFNGATAVLNYAINMFESNNFYFSRINNVVYANLIFNGYRITLV